MASRLYLSSWWSCPICSWSDTCTCMRRSNDPVETAFRLGSGTLGGMPARVVLTRRGDSAIAAAATQLSNNVAEGRSEIGPGSSDMAVYARYQRCHQQYSQVQCHLGLPS